MFMTGFRLKHLRTLYPYPSQVVYFPEGFPLHVYRRYLKMGFSSAYWIDSHQCVTGLGEYPLSCPWYIGCSEIPF
jgi:hypothetical protein